MSNEISSSADTATLSPPTSATVFVVDDDAAVRRSLSRVVRSAGYTVETFASPADFLQQELPPGPACVVLDMNMDEMSGQEVHDALRQGDRHMPVVFLTGFATVKSAVTEVKKGAADFLEKPVRAAVLIDAVSRAVDSDRARGELRHRFDTLTPREQEVMCLVVSGRLNKQSAAELGISEKTIKVHRARVMEKMEVESLAALVRAAERLGMAVGQAPFEKQGIAETVAADR